MERENRELLLKDLSARLSYEVKISIPNLWTHKIEIEILDEIFKGDDGLYRVNSSGLCIEYIKPYLFPMSSITEEQIEELEGLCWYFDFYEIYNIDKYGCKEVINHLDCFDLIDWLNAHHFDYRGLIEKGLAIDATGLNIY